MSGTYMSVSDYVKRTVGLPPSFGITGSWSRQTGPYLNVEDDDEMLDKLMGRLMVHTQKVIIPCKWCGSHNAFSNPTCVKCGGPLG